MSAVEQGRIDERVVDAAVSRILDLKVDLELYDQAEPTALDSETLDAVQAVANDIGEACAAAGLGC